MRDAAGLCEHRKGFRRDRRFDGQLMTWAGERGSCRMAVVDDHPRERAALQATANTTRVQRDRKNCRWIAGIEVSLDFHRRTYFSLDRLTSVQACLRGRG